MRGAVHGSACEDWTGHRPRGHPRYTPDVVVVPILGRWYRDFSPVSDAEVLALLGGVPDEKRTTGAGSSEFRITVAGVELAGDLTFPAEPRGLVIFAHGSGSSRLSPRNRAVAATLNDAGFATLLFDLLTEDEARRRELVFDIPLLARRLELVTRWALEEPATKPAVP